eukprot:COSAG04_NODE_5181_length_1712_cov_1.629262_1_plen_178_part_00
MGGTSGARTGTRRRHRTAAGWPLLAALVLSSAVGLLRAEEQDVVLGVLPEPSAEARERAAAHARKNPVTLRTWKWLTKATNAARGHDRWGTVLDAGTGPGSMSYLSASLPAVCKRAAVFCSKIRRLSFVHLPDPYSPVHSPVQQLRIEAGSRRKEAAVLTECRGWYSEPGRQKSPPP